MSFSRVYLSGSKADPDRIYYNATIASNTLPSANNVLQNSVPLTFGESRQAPLVVDASRYEVQVENVTLSGVTKTLPLFIPTIANPTIDAQTTIYTVYVNVFDGTSYKQGSAPIVWYPEDPYLIIPATFLPTAITGSTRVTTAASGNFPASTAVTLNVASSTGYSVGMQISVTGVTPSTYNGSYVLTAVGINTLTYVTSSDPGAWVSGGTVGLATIYQSESAYYYDYTYDHWIKLVNNALNAAWLSAGGGVSFGTKCPFFQYDETTGLFNLNQDCYTSLTAIGTPLPSPYNVSATPPSASNVTYTSVSVTSGVATFTMTALPTAPYNNGQIVQVPGLTPTGPYTVISSTTTQVVVNIVGATGTPSATGTLTPTNYATGEYSFVGMNKQLFQLLSNFNVITNPDGKVWGSGLNYPEIVFDLGLTLNSNIVNGTTLANGLGTGLKNYPTITSYPIINPFTAAALQPYARLTQNFVSTSNWSPVSSIVVGTTKIPVRNEDESGTYNFGTSNVGIENGASSNFFKLLIEFPMPMQTADLTRQFILYQPLIPTFSSMDDSHVDIHDVDFQFYWRNNRTGQLNPLKIDTGSSATVRLCFEKKK